MRIAIITDIHEDFDNLREAIRLIEKQGCDEIICLGDISGYSIPYYNYLVKRNAHNCLSLLREKCSAIIIGNHDIYAAKIKPQISPFFDFPDEWYQMDYQQRKSLGGETIWLHEENDLDPLYSIDDISFLKNQPQYIIKKFANFNVMFSHYAYPNISGIKKDFYTYTDEFGTHFDFMEKQNCSIAFMGHSHAKGIFYITPKKFRQYRRNNRNISDTPVIISCPPITRYRKKSRFCIFDTDTVSITFIRF